MVSMPAVELPAQPAADADAENVPVVGVAVARLGTAMAVLGAIRLAGEVLRYAGIWREAQASGLIASRGWGGFLADYPPFYLPIYAWPLLLGLVLRRTRARGAIGAAALTFLVLSIGGALSVVADLGQHGGRWVSVGSFRVPRMDWSRLPAAAMAMGLAGAAQLLMEFAAALCALVLAFRRDTGGPISDRHAPGRRATFNRLALGLSVAFLVLTIRLPAWSTYVELLTQSQWVREFILRDDFARIRTTRHALQPESGWAIQARWMLEQAVQAWRDGRYAESSDHYAHLAALLDTVPTAGMSAGERRLAAQALNNWAWLLAICPEPALRKPADSLKYARRALELEPNDGPAWNTLGVANFRLGAWDDALSALYRSMELRDEGDSNDWFFLAMIHERLGHKERAREWYDKAVEWAQVVEPENDELFHFEVEAAATLGLPRPEKPPRQAPRRPGPGPLRMPPYSGRRARTGQRIEGSQGPRDASRSFGGSPRRRSPNF